MAENSSIEWTDATWNPVVGCSKVSPGCAHCYAERMALRLRAMAQAKIEKGEDPGRLRHYLDVVDEHGRWTGKLALVPESLEDPLAWRKPRKIFVNSMSDLFHADVPNGVLDLILCVMTWCDWHTFQVLTKRSARMREYLHGWQTLDRSVFAGRVATACGAMHFNEGMAAEVYSRLKSVPQNIWWGVSIENQQTADERIFDLVATPAAVRIVSAEPLLGPVDLLKFCHDSDFPVSLDLDWVIVGGESGPSARPMHAAWARSIRDQCQAAGVPFFFKQWGEWIEDRDSPSPVPVPTTILAGTPAECTVMQAPPRAVKVVRPSGGDRIFRPDGKFTGEPPQAGDAWMVKVGKKHAGRLLDGRTWDEFPPTSSLIPPTSSLPS